MVKIAAIICAILIYIPFCSFETKTKVKSLIEPSKITRIQGKVNSSPVKSDFKGGSYRTLFYCQNAFSSDIESQCSGMANVYFPTNIVESLYPGKIYTSQSNDVLIEDGIFLDLDVIPINMDKETVFYVKKILHHHYTEDFLHQIKRFRGQCRLYFKRLMYGWNEAGGLLLALLSGSREYTEKSVNKAFIDSGLAHILALSGMHISLFGGIALLFGKKISTKRIADGIQLFAIIFFVWFAGLSPSLFRALLCALITFLASIFKINKPKQLDVLGTCFLIHAIIFPQHLTQVSFMLSYLALAGILIISPKINRSFSKRFFPNVSNSFSQSLGSQIMTLPVSLGIFKRFVPIGVFSCLIVTPLVMIFLYLGLAGVFLCLILPFLSPVFNVIMNMIYCGIRESVLFFSMFPIISL